MAESVNTEEIMVKIRENIKTRDYSDLELNFDDINVAGVSRGELDDLRFDENEFADEIAAVNTFYGVNYYEPLDGSGLKLACKKFIRKFMKPVAAPLIARQNLYNNASAKSLSQIYAYIRDKEAENKALRDKVDSLEKKIAELEKKA